MNTKWNLLMILALLVMLAGVNVAPARAAEISVGGVRVVEAYSDPPVEITSSIVATEIRASAAVPGYYEGLTCNVDFGDGNGNGNVEEEGWYTTDPRSCGARSHYTTAGTFTITITVASPDGTSVSSTTTHTVTYTDVGFYDGAPIYISDPGMTKLLEPSTVNETVIAFTYAEDAHSYYSAHNCTVNYGDGSGPEPGTLSYSSGWFAVCMGLEHAYTVPGTYTITFTLTGYNGLTATKTSSHVVTDAAPYQTAGFTAPLDLGGVLNTAKAGQMIPLKWLLLDGSGLPVTNLTTSDITLTVSLYACPSGEATDAVEAYTTGTTELQNLGDGYYQMNWKTDKTWANACKQLTLKIGTWTGDGLTALFQFKK